MYRHFTKCAEYARDRRKGNRLIVVHDGDAIDGNHHGSLQAVTFDPAEQAEVHIELMDTFLRTANFTSKTDRLFYVSGTETHVGDGENGIAADLEAEGGKVFDHLELEINGRLIWFVHHGPKRGKGALEGNALRNYLRDTYWDAKKINVQPPDMIVTGHVHTATYNNYVIREKDSYRIIHGVICPSFQAKTRFTYKVAPIERNEIGCVFIEIGASGAISVPAFLLQETKGSETVKL